MSVGWRVDDLYSEKRDVVRRHVARLVGDDNAEDLVHDAFIAYITHRPEADRPDAWLMRVARNRALNQLRRSLPAGATQHDEDDLPADVERAAVGALVSRALDTLRPRARRALELRFFEEAGYDEIADDLGVRVEQAHVVVHRAVRSVGRALVKLVATQHDAASCVRALERVAGFGIAADDHVERPCALCAPAWDELNALRALPALMPAFLVRWSGRAAQIAGAVARAVDPSGAAIGAMLAVTVLAGGGAMVAPAHAPRAAAAVAVAPARQGRAPRRLVSRAWAETRAGAVRPAPGGSTVRAQRDVAGGGPVGIRSGGGATQAHVASPSGGGGAVVCKPLEPCPPPPSR